MSLLTYNKQLTWREMKALYSLYTYQRTEAKVLQHPYFQYLKIKKIIGTKPGYPHIIIALKGFKAEYEKEDLKDYLEAEKFLTDHDILTDQSRYTLEEIGILRQIWNDRYDIIKKEWSQKQIATYYFQSAKYLDEREGLDKAVLRLLGLTRYPKLDSIDSQYVSVVFCENAERVLLCENIHYLTQPWKARALKTALWYAGGNNVQKLEHTREQSLPIYYSCDWDYDGLRIYTRISNILRQIGIGIVLLVPVSNAPRKPVNSPHHNSHWKSLPFSGLTTSSFSTSQRLLIEELINKDQWIEEESNDFPLLLKHNSLIP